MKFWIPWVVSFLFGLCIFLIGMLLQKIEKKRYSEAKSARARASMYFGGEASRSALHELEQDDFFREQLGRYPGGEFLGPGAQPGKIGPRLQ